MSHYLNSKLEQWLFTLLKKRKTEGKHSEHLNAIIHSLQKGYSNFTQEAFEEILEHLKDEYEGKIIIDLNRVIEDPEGLWQELVDQSHGKDVTQ